jgi:hypothetical protein
MNKSLVGKPEGNKPFGRPRNKWDDNIEINHEEIVLEGVDWFHLVQDREL